jgi:hypothetical protein
MPWRWTGRIRNERVTIRSNESKKNERLMEDGMEGGTRQIKR